MLSAQRTPLPQSPPLPSISSDDNQLSANQMQLVEFAQIRRRTFDTISLKVPPEKAIGQKGSINVQKCRFPAARMAVFCWAGEITLQSWQACRTSGSLWNVDASCQWSVQENLIESHTAAQQASDL